MIVPRYYEDLKVLHEIQCRQGHIMCRRQERWIAWWRTGSVPTGLYF